MRNRFPSIAALLCACSSPPPRPAEPIASPRELADLVLLGGTIVTLDPGRKEAAALAIRGGEITAVGGEESVRAWIGETTRVVDLKGATALPGLADSHMHLAGLGTRRFGIDLVGTKSVREIAERVRAAAKDAAPGEWIRGRGWDQNDWSTGKSGDLAFPTAQDLDRAAPKNPVVLGRIDGHALWVSSKAMELAGLTPKTRDPKGGRIVRRRGRPTGVLIDGAMDLVSSRMPALGGEDLLKAIRVAEEECVAAGLTQVHDMGTSPEELASLAELDRTGALRLRVYAMHDGSHELLSEAIAAGPRLPQEQKRLTARGVKFMVDGALGSRGAALLAPYSDDPKNSGLLSMDPEVFEARVRTVSERGFQVATHAIGDRGNRLVLDAYERVFGGDIHAARPRVEHAQILDPADIPRFGKLGVVASMQPTHATSDMKWAEQRLGPRRLKGAYAWRSLLTASATIAAGSDAPVEDISPVLGLYAAITRKDLFGLPEEGWLPHEKMSPMQALTAFTWGAAWASFREGEAGRLAPGRDADITVMDRNPLTSTEDELAGARVMLTIIGGEIVFSRPGADTAPETLTSTAS